MNVEALDLLKQEHDVIERVLDLLQKAVARIEAGQPVPEGFQSWSVQFFRQFADRCHHGKEEDILFPLLEQRGIPRDGGPIGVMLNEHVIGRDCVGRMDQAASVSPPDDKTFAVAANEYIPLLRQHIFKENNVLFQMARQCLSEQDAADTMEKFRSVEEEKGGPEFHERYEAEVEQWEEAFAA
jgi:hemerythrin-like domain-containing protein